MIYKTQISTIISGEKTKAILINYSVIRRKHGRLCMEQIFLVDND